MSEPLTQESLTKALIEIRNQLGDGSTINLRPTKLYIPQYPGESFEDYKRRVAKARRMIAKLMKEATP